MGSFNSDMYYFLLRNGLIKLPSAEESAIKSINGILSFLRKEKIADKFLEDRKESG